MSGRGAVVGLDIGHATICACIGRVDDGRVHLFGSSVVATDGVERGAIVDERRLASAVARALDQVEQMSNMRSEKRVVLGVGGVFVGGWPGAAGTDLQFGPLAKFVRGLGLHVEHVVPTAQAAARAVLLPAERTRTAAVVDIGEESSDVVFFRDGGAVLHAVVPVGGRHVTHDIAYGLGVPVAEAEQLKLRFAAAIQELTTVPRVGGAATERARGCSISSSRASRNCLSSCPRCCPRLSTADDPIVSFLPADRRFWLAFSRLRSGPLILLYASGSRKQPSDRPTSSLRRYTQAPSDFCTRPRWTPMCRSHKRTERRADDGSKA